MNIEDEQIASIKKVTPDEVWQYLQETSRVIKEANEDIKQRFQETDRKFQETDRKFLETEKYIKELGSQIGGLHNKFGFFTEGLMIPSITRILRENFNCSFVAPNPLFRNNGDSFEIDLLGVSNTACYLVEIKSKFRADVIEQHTNKLENFNKFETRYSDLPKFGIIAATNYQEKDIKIILNAGFYFISLADSIANLITPDDFTPKQWI